MPKVYLLFNPKSGIHRTRMLLETSLKILTDKNIEVEVVETEYPRHAFDLARTLDFNGFEGLCALGGDGTMHEMVNGLLNREDSKRIPLGILPAGTGNSYLYDRNMLELSTVAEKISELNVQDIDLLQVDTQGTTHYSFNIVGWGMMAQGNVTAEKLRWLGKRRYDAGALWEIAKLDAYRAKVKTNGEVYEYDMHFVLGANTIHTGTGMKMAPRAVLNDGLLDLILVRAGTRLDLLKLFPRIFSGEHIHSPLLQYLQVKEFELETKSEMILNLDGETIGTTPCRVKVLPNDLQVLL
jgi:YegS/Rv2252/BmrU family lipid kinase